MSERKFYDYDLSKEADQKRFEALLDTVIQINEDYVRDINFSCANKEGLVKSSILSMLDTAAVSMEKTTLELLADLITAEVFHISGGKHEEDN